jgi:hypothetical protein
MSELEVQLPQCMATGAVQMSFAVLGVLRGFPILRVI